MSKLHTPDGMAPPFGHYSHGVEVAPSARWLYLSGQVGAQPDGTVPDGIEAQAEWAWKNIARRGRPGTSANGKTAPPARARDAVHMARGRPAPAARQPRCTQVVLSWVYFSIACSDLSRPKPDCL